LIERCLFCAFLARVVSRLTRFSKARVKGCCGQDRHAGSPADRVPTGMKKPDAAAGLTGREEIVFGLDGPRAATWSR
jgi:hypothetical protein